MYTNERLEEKYKAQQKLSQKAEKEKKDFLKLLKVKFLNYLDKMGRR